MSKTKCKTTVTPLPRSNINLVLSHEYFLVFLTSQVCANRSLWGHFIGHRLIPSQKVCNATLWYFRYWNCEQADELKFTVGDVIRHANYAAPRQHVEAETKLPPFHRRHFQILFCGWKWMHFDQYVTDQVTSHYLKRWWWVYWSIYTSLGRNESITSVCKKIVLISIQRPIRFQIDSAHIHKVDGMFGFLSQICRKPLSQLVCRSYFGRHHSRKFGTVTPRS